MDQESKQEISSVVPLNDH